MKYLIWGFIYSILVLGVTFYEIFTESVYKWEIIPAIWISSWKYGSIVLISFIFFELFVPHKSIPKKILVIILAVLINFILFPLLFLPIDDALVSWQRNRLSSEEYLKKEKLELQQMNLEQFNWNKKKINNEYNILVDIVNVENGRLSIYTKQDTSSLLWLFESHNDPMENNSDILYEEYEQEVYFDTLYRKVLVDNKNNFNEIFYNDDYIYLINSKNEVLRFQGSIKYDFDSTPTEEKLVVMNKRDPRFATVYSAADIVLEEKKLSNGNVLKLFWYKSTTNDKSSAVALVEYINGEIPDLLEYNSEWNLPGKIGDYNDSFLEIDERLGNRVTIIKDGKKIKFLYFITNEKQIGVKEQIQLQNIPNDYYMDQF